MLFRSCANLAGYFGNHFSGWLRSHHATETTCLLFLAACYLLGGVVVSFVNVERKPVSVPATVAPEVSKA